MQISMVWCCSAGQVKLMAEACCAKCDNAVEIRHASNGFKVKLVFGLIALEGSNCIVYEEESMEDSD